jgi:hypothetical protein
MKLLNNLAAVASKRLQMRKRTRDDEHLPLLQAGDVYLGQHTTGASNTAGAIGPTGASNIVGTSEAVGASNLAGANAFPLTVALPGTNITPGASGSASANFTLGMSRSIGWIQASFVTWNTTGQPENVGDQVEPWSICTRSTSFGNGTSW